MALATLRLAVAGNLLGNLGATSVVDSPFQQGQRRHLPKGMPKRGKKGAPVRTLPDLNLLTEEQLMEKVKAEREERIGRLRRMVKYPLPADGEEIPPWIVEAVKEALQPDPSIDEIGPDSKRWWKLLRREKIKSSNAASKKGSLEELAKEEKAVVKTVDTSKALHDPDDIFNFGGSLVEEIDIDPEGVHSDGE